MSRINTLFVLLVLLNILGSDNSLSLEGEKHSRNGLFFVVSMHSFGCTCPLGIVKLSRSDFSRDVEKEEWFANDRREPFFP